jgi:hypothetical protein
MDLKKMRAALTSVETAIVELRNAGENGLASEAIGLMEKCLQRYEAEGGDRTMFDVCLF